MKKIVTSLMAGVMALSFVGAGAISANAAEMYLPQKAPVPQFGIQDVAWRGHKNMYRRGGHHYWRGHRGYDRWRPGYRRHGDFWFPLAAFATGAIVSGAIANGSNARGDAHVQWCYDHYRSYRASDNTYQPYNGPRRQCRSPY